MNTTGIFKKHGKEITVIKSSGAEKTTSAILTHPENIDTLRRAFIFMFSSPSGYIDSGDFIRKDSDYYIVATTENNTFNRATNHTTGLAFRCNADITLERFVSGSGLVTQSGIIRSCISSTKLFALDDKSFALDEAGRRRSNEPKYYCYVRASEDIQENDKLTHGSRKLKVLKNIDPYFADGLKEVSVVIVD